MQIKTICSKCGIETTYEINKIEQQDVIILGKKYLATYVKCQHCRNKMVMQIDNSETQKMLVDCKELLRRKVKAKHKGKAFNEKSNTKLSKLQEELRHQRKLLGVNLHGLSYYDTKDCEEKQFLDCSFIIDSIKESEGNKNVRKKEDSM